MPSYDCSTLTRQQPPLVYDLNQDPAEKFPLDSMKHAELLKRARNLVENHRENLVVPPPQFDTFDPALRPCCNPPHCLCSNYRDVGGHELTGSKDEL